MDLHSRRDLMDSMSERYRRAAKTSKTRILDEVCAATGFHRKYAITRINLVGEFINHNLYGYCHGREIGFTRGRPYKKDDNAHIEQKNWTHVRKLIGWDRYETPESVAALNDLYANELRLYMNLFQPSVKLIRTVRKGSRKVRRYDEPRTPLDRLVDMPGANRQKVEQLFQLRSRLDPFTLAAIFRRKLDRIWEMRHTGKRTVKPKGVSDMEISRSLSRTLSSPHVVSSSL